MWIALQRIAPRPMPGKTYILLFKSAFIPKLIWRTPRKHSLSLTGLHHLSIVQVWWERASTCKDGFSASIFHGFLERAFSITRWIRKRKDDWAFVHLSHLLEDGLVKDSSYCGQSHQNCWLDIFNNFGQGFKLLPPVVIPREVYLVLGKLISPVVGYKTLRSMSTHALYWPD